ncbi:hypothetical protein RvY_18468 [Ramazzottius varieornatus]|uniref:Uncharacterized protein n=1 Tax=Ramazzottius varieornatus TaxID=947166 RepID=A0A1D1W5W6_RAMVA|nr:hypothetical protein RvY_18468 [Ramazzottius varieornatus]
MFIKVNDAGSSALPSRTTRRIRAADLLQLYDTAASQAEVMRDLNKIERQNDMEERRTIANGGKRSSRKNRSSKKNTRKSRKKSD